MSITVTFAPRTWLARTFLGLRADGQRAIDQQLSGGGWIDQRYVEFASTSPEGAA